MDFSFYCPISFFYRRKCQAGFSSTVLQKEPSAKRVIIGADELGMKKVTNKIDEGK